MRIRTALATSVVLAVASGSLAPALAAPAKAKAKPKPVTKTYTATAPLPSPVNFATGVCNADVPQSAHDEVVTAPFAGRLTVKMTGFVGDWDLALRSDGSNAAESAQDAAADAIDRPEEIAGYKLKKGEAITIRACNFAGGSTASVTYTLSPL